MYRRRGFTLIELLVVIAIIARPDRAAAAGRAGGPRGGPPRPVRQQPEADRPGPAQLPRRRSATFPPGYVSDVDPDGDDTGPGWGWAAMILPQIEQAPVFNAINFGLADRDPRQPDGTR